MSSNMSSKNLAISVRGLSKSYTITHNAVQHNTLASLLMHKLRHPFERMERETFWALQEIDFDICKGDVVGVIGRNGAGKSTLLKILSRITEPTTGKIALYGRLGSLLEVGTGFHPELTGRENIFMNGAILGMTRQEIRQQFDAIVDFAGVTTFLDTPVKRYSSGMYVRLAFAVAAHLNPEILVVDEVLAVGDAEFQNKCLGKMRDVASSGRTVLFVSHNMQSVSLLCNKGIFLRGGRITYQGDAQGAVQQYLSSFAPGAQPEARSERRPGTGEYRFTEVEPVKEVFSSEEIKCLRFTIAQRKQPIGQMYLSMHIVNDRGADIIQCDSRLVGRWIEDAAQIEGTFQFTQPWLQPGSYRVDMYLCAVGVGIVDKFEGACSLHISPILPYPYPASEDATAFGTVLSDFQWNINQ